MRSNMHRYGVQASAPASTSISTLLAATALAMLWSSPAWALEADASDSQIEPDDELRDAIVVTGRRDTAADAKQAARDIAGAATVIDSSSVERGRSGNLEDLLAFQPGVFAQAADGTGAAKISIRGSGIQTSPGYFREGIKFLYDGLPLTGPGGTPDEMLDGAAVSYTEVLYGGNAFKYSAATLGGAINYVTQTGVTAPGLRVSLAGGSYGNRSILTSLGGTSGDLDYFIAYKGDRRDGFREGTYNGDPITNYGRGTNVIANLGYRPTDSIDLRLNFRYRREFYVNGTTLTRAQLENDPTTLAVISARKKRGSYLAGFTAGFDFDDDSRLEIGFGYSHYPHVNAWRYSARPAYWNWTDWTGTVRYNRADTLFGLKSVTNFSIAGTYNGHGRAKTYEVATGALFNDVEYSGSYDLVSSIGNDLQLLGGAHELWLTTGLSVVTVRRDVRVNYSAPNNPNLTPFGTAVDRTDTLAAPRVGLRYQLTPAFQLVGNISRSIDPSSSWGLAGSSSAYVRDLRPQRATTFEAGVRLSTDALEGSLTVYRANLRDELLTIVLAQATETTDAVIVKANANKTIHQGIEAGLTARLWQSEAGDNITLRQAYTLNDFRYDDDPTFGDNDLPGLPRQTYQGELQFQHASGFYIGGNIRVASGYHVDYANSLKAPSYAIFGARLGYEDPKDRFKIFVDLRNLTDKTYVSATSPQYDLGGADSNVFYPGEGFSAFAGLTVNF